MDKLSAEERAEELYYELQSYSNGHLGKDGIPSIATAIREARQQAFRECAEIARMKVESIRRSGLKGGEPNAYQSAARQIAEAIERAAATEPQGD